MNEKDYIVLNDLLTRYRVEVLRRLGRMKDTTSVGSRSLVRQLRSIDYLRNNMFLIDEIIGGNEDAEQTEEIQEEKVSE